ncbi:MAG: 50S ribosomal protein L9 [Verrucomicrobiota bacterium]|nr:50S ribosomal protein L9 [Verrucomicrobiota bacterium]
MVIEVILTTNIRNLGSEGDKVTVRPGYARNFLIPTGRAIPATQASVRRLEELKRKRAEREAGELNEANALATKLNKLTLTFTLKTGHEDKAFGTISANDIQERLKAEGYDFDRKQIKLEKPIRAIGKTELEITLLADIIAKVNIDVVPEVKEKPKFEKNDKFEKGDKKERAPRKPKKD